MQIENIGISEIKVYEKNPRRNQDAVEYVANSISEFGFKVPIVIDRNNVIVCGHTRYLAAERIGLKTIPCIKADDLTDEQIKAFRLADNKTAEMSEWDYSLLEEELAGLAELEFDMSSFGFFIADDDYLENMFDEQEEETSQSDDNEDDVEEECYSVTVTFDNGDDLEAFIEYCERENISYERGNAN